MPATCAFIGTPASISARQPPQTEAIDERAVRFGDFGHHAHRVGELFRRRQHRDQRALGQAAVADFAALRRADAAGFAGGERRHVVVEHEAVVVLAHQRVDLLLVALGAERRDDQRLRFAAREQRRAVGARQHAGADLDRAHGARVAAVDARLAGQDLAAHDLRFDVEQHVADLAGVVGATRPAAAQSASTLAAISRDALACGPAWCGSGRRRAALLRPAALTLAISASSLAGGCQSHTGLPASRTSSWIALMTACTARGRTPRRRASFLRTAAALRIRPSARPLRCRRRPGPAATSCELRSWPGSARTGHRRSRRARRRSGRRTGCRRSTARRDAPIIAAMSGSTSGLTDNTVRRPALR